MVLWPFRFNGAIGSVFDHGISYLKIGNGTVVPPSHIMS